MSRLADLLLGTGKLRSFTFTRTRRDGISVDVSVLIRALTKHESDIARVAAKRTVQDLEKVGRDATPSEELLAEARLVEMLSVALRDPDDPDNKPWASPLEIASMLDVGTIAMLGQEYERHQEECGPFLQDMTQEQRDALIERIAEDANADPFFLCAFPLQKAFIISLVREFVSLKTRMSSSGSADSSLSSESASESEKQAGTSEALSDVFAELEVHRGRLASLGVRLESLEAAKASATHATE
jgi:hypothetical protein